MTLSIGLISDTHYPERCRQLPDSIFTTLDGVDMILHAGDVGELSVLDQLSQLAPVIAVHGNDDTQESRQSLPYKTVVAAAGTRIFLWHSHYEDRKEEFASRQGDAFLPRLRRTAQQAIAAKASIAVFGHWHIPLVRMVDSVTIINPGAVASGNAITRQLKQTVAVLEIETDGTHVCKHIDLAEPDGDYKPAIIWKEGFTATLDHFSASILSPELQAKMPGILSQISEEEQSKLLPILLSLSRSCWDGDFSQINSELLKTELDQTTTLSAQDKLRYSQLLD